MKLIFSRFWRPEDQDQDRGASRVGFFWHSFQMAAFSCILTWPFLCVGASLCLPFLIGTPVRLDWGPTQKVSYSFYYLPPERSCLQIQSHAEVLWVRNSTYEFARDIIQLIPRWDGKLYHWGLEKGKFTKKGNGNLLGSWGPSKYNQRSWSVLKRTEASGMVGIHSNLSFSQSSRRKWQQPWAWYKRRWWCSRGKQGLVTYQITHRQICWDFKRIKRCKTQSQTSKTTKSH